MTRCQYFPCHKGIPADFSCEFCYCPEYERTACSGHPKFILDKNDKKLKDCSQCTVNHTEAYIKQFYLNGGKDGYGKVTGSKDS